MLVTSQRVFRLGLFFVGISSGSGSATMSPTVALDSATFVGTSDGPTHQFLGIPYARPPTGELRFNHPVLVDPYTGSYSATEFGFSCPQQRPALPTTLPPGLQAENIERLMGTCFNLTHAQSEDCLNLNVWMPSDVRRGANLPVVVWIPGGSFQVGSGALFDGGVIVERAIQLGEPVIFVSINYRLSALGWLAGKEARDAGIGNLGYRDQRLALRWIQKYIHAFGGDSSKVVIWGESAGAISIAAQMVTNGGDTEGLFRGAFMQSGSFLLSSDMLAAQHYYDNLVQSAGCAGASDSLHCLRHIPFSQLKAAMDDSPSFLAYQSLAEAWTPRADGLFLPQTNRKLAAKGHMARVPVVMGVCEDEGTVFALASLNITTTNELRTYLSSYYFVNASHAELDELLAMYSEDPVYGSPFSTGTLNAITSQFKRIAALQGDITFEAPKRVFLEETVGRANQDVWVYVNKRRKDTPVLGAAHITDLYDMFGPTDVTDHLIHFVNYLDPNGAGASHIQGQGSELDVPHTQANFRLGPSTAANVIWPKYDMQSRAILAYTDGPSTVELVRDGGRDEQVKFVADFLSKHPVL